MYVPTKKGDVIMERKEIVKVLSRHFETTPRYLGAPSFAYEVEAPGQTFTIDRLGTITTYDGTEVVLEEIIGKEQTEEQVVESVPNIINLELSLPLEGHSGATLKNIVNIISSKQHLLKKALGVNHVFMDEEFAKDMGLIKTDTIEEFRNAFEELGKERCKGIIFDFEANAYTFNIPADKMNYEKIAAFTELATHINENAKEQKRTSYKVTQDDNPKFALRTWLIRLGMKGDGYKDIRRVLLENLEGNGAFRTLPNERGTLEQ
jgi:hypothetical protein